MYERVRTARHAPEVTAARTMRAGGAALEDSIAGRRRVGNGARRANAALERARFSAKAAPPEQSTGGDTACMACGNHTKRRRDRMIAKGQFSKTRVIVSHWPVHAGYSVSENRNAFTKQRDIKRFKTKSNKHKN